MNPDDARVKAGRLKQLREQHQVGVAATQALLKEQQAIRKELRQALREGPRTVPEIVIAMKKYGLVTETGLDDGYYRYRLTEGARQ
jgi:hypothetical protein